ncbi:MAG: DNA/RNA nuclease SfsA, partial [Litorivicinaceae bacterium]
MIDYQATLIEGRLISRYKRFFADIDTGDGVITAHCANTGRMTGLLEKGSRVWFRKQPPGRKLVFSWELVEVASGMACINTARANDLLF